MATSLKALFPIASKRENLATSNVSHRQSKKGGGNGGKGKERGKNKFGVGSPDGSLTLAEFK